MVDAHPRCRHGTGCQTSRPAFIVLLTLVLLRTFVQLTHGLS